MSLIPGKLLKQPHPFTAWVEPGNRFFIVRAPTIYLLVLEPGPKQLNGQNVRASTSPFAKYIINSIFLYRLDEPGLLTKALAHLTIAQKVKTGHIHGPEIEPRSS
eukprot:TRINITY_DN18701_c0_g2_i1.p2 TRINITY_DN18701_c0_g2~~TRINITY_DN18701_c0_g2_i1.p2  ORF type:complete len:105 (-),score=5.85 TRINITY_DN18701_c0_g2_i1:1173-1487(-)